MSLHDTFIARQRIDNLPLPTADRCTLSCPITCLKLLQSYKYHSHVLTHLIHCKVLHNTRISDLECPFLSYQTHAYFLEIRIKTGCNPTSACYAEYDGRSLAEVSG
jgi:hypothetical protein